MGDTFLSKDEKDVKRQERLPKIYHKQFAGESIFDLQANNEADSSRAILIQKSKEAFPIQDIKTKSPIKIKPT